VALLGNGVVIHMPDLLKEIAENEGKGDDEPPNQ
jgi:adenylosuccinate synthase